METEKVIQGREVTASEIGVISDLLTGNPDWNRSRLSRELCERWGWRNGKGRLKDMAARTLLLKLEGLGENLKIMVSDRAGRLLACMLFGSAAWNARSRDAFIGWDRPTRERNDVDQTLSVPVKEIFLYPLHSDFRGRLLA